MSSHDTAVNGPEIPSFDPKKYLVKLQQVLDRSHNFLDDGEPANYDAVFSEENEPFFLNIWNHQPGTGFGYLVFHDFLLNVGTGNTFGSTKFTEDGYALFEKAVHDNLIEPVDGGGGGFVQSTRWKVVGDPKENLEKIRDSLIS